MAKQTKPKTKKVVHHPENCDQCDGSGFVSHTWISHGVYTEGVKRCPNWIVEETNETAG